MNELEKAQLAVEQANQAVLAASETIRKLVAENLALKKYAKIDDYDKCDNCGFESYVMPIETPATDAAIAEIKAQGVALAISHLSKKFTNLGVPITSLEWLEVELRAGRKG